MSLTSQLYNSQLIGIELEFYSLYTVDTMSMYLISHDITDFEAVHDGSLYNYNENSRNYYGVELRLKFPVNIKQVPKKLAELHAIISDPPVGATFNDDENLRGTTGMHVHFGLSSQYSHNILDMFRLLKNVYANESKIEILGHRPCNRWARSMKPIINDVNKSISSLSPAASAYETIESKLKYLMNTRGFNLKESIENSVRYTEKYASFTHQARDLSEMFKSFSHMNSIYNAIRNLDGGTDTILSGRISTITNSDDLSGNQIIINRPVSSGWISNDNTYQIWTITEHTTENENTFKVSDFIDIYKKLQHYGSRQDPHRILINKYIDKHAEIDPLMNELTQALKIDHLYTGFTSSFNMNKIRIMYDLFNNHVERAAYASCRYLRFKNKINAVFTDTYRQTSNVNLQTPWFTDIAGYSYDDNRYFGANATNIGYYSRENKKKINTVEFRWASSTISTSLENMTNYFKCLESIFFNSFTGESVLKWDRYTLTNITDISKRDGKIGHIFTVSNEEKLLMGRIHCNTLSKKIEVGYNKLIDDYMIKYEHTSSNASKHKLRKRISHEIYNHKKTNHMIKTKLNNASKCNNKKIYDEILKLARNRNFDAIYSLKS